jgi:hypothetical protein
MIRTGWWLADAASQLLEPHERDAVRGDLAECRVGGWRALCEVLGLVARRQAACWLDWRPWLAVAAIVLPIGLLLSHATRWWADAYAFDILGGQRDLVPLVWSAIVISVILAGWSWTSGYVLASFSGRTVWMLSALFALVVFLGTLGTTTVARTNAVAFAGHLIGVVLPRLVRFFLVVLPALWGMRCSRRASVSPWMLAIGAGVLIALTPLAVPLLESSLTLGRGVYPSIAALGPDNTSGTADDLRPLWPIPLVMLWPTAAILISTLWRRASVSS